MKADFAKKYKYVIGIDTGCHTGFSVWSQADKKFVYISTVAIHVAIKKVQEYKREGQIFVRVEDARKRKWFGKAGREQLQGAGSIKRDAKIWEDFLSDIGIDFEMVAPKNNKTKLNDASFKKITGWQGRTSVHARDAAMMCFNF